LHKELLRDAAVFQVDEIIEDEQEGRLAIETTGIEYYTKEGGLIRRFKQITSELYIDMVQTARWNMEELKTGNARLYEVIQSK
jgi:hypothetical protein